MAKLKPHQCGVVSTGTVHPEHLVIAFYDFLDRVGFLNKRLRRDVLSCFIFTVPYDENKSLSEYLYYDEIELNDADKLMYCLDALWNCLEDIAPDGYYFGALEGDASCIGYFNINSDM